MDIKFLEGPECVEKQPPECVELYTLRFEYTFTHDYEVVYFAHFMPYSYTDLQNYLCKLHADDNLADRMRVDHLCNSLGK